MLLFLNKLFVRTFYKTNAGFFLFFFFVFFGAVPGGTLPKYHYDIMQGILGSVVTLGVVLFCWTFYHIKCAGFVLKMVNSQEGSLLYNIQAVKKTTQWLHCLFVYLLLYLPVLL